MRDRLQQTFEIEQRLNLRLARKQDARPGIERRVRRTREQLRIDEACARGARELAVEQLCHLTRCQEQVAVHALEVTRDAFELDDVFDALDRGRMALVRDARALLPMQLLQLGKAII